MTSRADEEGHLKDEEASPTPHAVEQPVLVPKLDPRWAMGWPHVALVAFFCAIFMLLNHFPLRVTDLWGHVNYGRWILKHQTLPAEDPFCPFAAGVPVIDTAWLSQVILAAVEKIGGPQGLSNLFAITLLASYLLLARAFYLQSKSLLATWLGSLAVLVVGWSRISTIRPENFGTLCFAILLWLIAAGQAGSPGDDRLATSGGRCSSNWWRWRVVIPLLFAFWANLHGSFICGLAVLWCFFLGALVENLWQTRSLRRLLADQLIRQWFAASALASLATLVNPYGFKLLPYVLSFAGRENLQGVLEWQPLVITGVGGREFALSWVLLLVVWRHSRQRIPVAHGLLLAMFASASVLGTRMLGWYAMVYALVLVPHPAELLARMRPKDDLTVQRTAGSENAQVVLPPGRSFLLSLLCLLLIWMTFALSPISAAVLGGRTRTLQRLLGPSTPLALTAYLRQHPPQGPIFSPQWWGDWLVFDGPPGLRPFVTMNIHLVRPTVWRDYRHIDQGLAGWERVLHRYRVQTLILDRRHQTILVPAVCAAGNWRLVYMDAKSAVMIRTDKAGKDA